MASVAALPETFALNAAVPPFPVCRLTVEHYEEMIRTGIIMEDDPIELLDGWLVPKMTKNPPHVVASELARNVLARALPTGWCVYSQNPVRLSKSVPEPDAMVARGDLRQYRDRLPRAEDIGLIVEVADASLYRDQVFKKAIYAQAGIPVYWLVNLVENRIEEYSQPEQQTGDGGREAGSEAASKADYRQRRDYTADMEVSLTLDGRKIASIPVRELLP